MIGVFGAVEVEPGLVNFCVTEKVSKENLDAVIGYLKSLREEDSLTSLREAERRGNLGN
jgi:hypothetical protein